MSKMRYDLLTFIFVVYLCHDLEIDIKGKELQHCIIPFYLTMTKGEQNLLESKIDKLALLKREE